MDSSQNLITLDPPQVLHFHLERGTEPRSVEADVQVLRVTNVTSGKVVFKVKTTQPSWYYVRPNQQILEPGQSEEVKVLLVGTECNRFLESAETGQEEKLDKHRFLVQSKVVSENEYAAIMSQPVARRNEEFSKLWEGSRDGLKNVKLKVEYTYDFSASAAKESSGKQATPVAMNVSPISGVAPEEVRGKLARSGNSNSALDSNTGSSATAANGSAAINSSSGSGFPANATPEAIFVELQSLRKKYDAVVEYTVHLTAERDAIVSQLDLAQHELAKEKSNKKKWGDAVTDTTSSSPGGKKKGDKSSEKKVVEKGFSLFVVLITALICFLIGKFLN